MPLDQAIQRIKIHPAIGFARMSTSKEYYTFDPQNPVRDTYKLQNKIMRQAIQYRLFAYDEDNNALYELTTEKLGEMGLQALWSAELSNGKIEEQTMNSQDRFQARGETGTGDLDLVGTLTTFFEGQAIAMGRLTNCGLFIPPEAKVFRRQPTTAIEDSGMFDENVSDNSSDGLISARLVDASTGNTIAVDVLPAWVSVCPQNFSPEANDLGDKNLLAYLQSLLNTPNRPPATPVNLRAQIIDRTMLERATAVFTPGIELAGPFNKRQFYSQDVTNDPDEIRIMPKRGNNGVTPGALTDNLCSPWQYDFRACTCSFWPNQRPDVAQKDDDLVNWRRKIAGQSGRRPVGGLLETNSDFIDHVDELGIVKGADSRLSDRIETERDNDISDGSDLAHQTGDDGCV